MKLMGYAQGAHRLAEQPLPTVLQTAVEPVRLPSPENSPRTSSSIAVLNAEATNWPEWAQKKHREIVDRQAGSTSPSQQLAELQQHERPRLILHTSVADFRSPTSTAEFDTPRT
jgi:hypothetical protein